MPTSGAITTVVPSLKTRVLLFVVQDRDVSTLSVDAALWQGMRVIKGHTLRKHVALPKSLTDRETLAHRPRWAMLGSGGYLANVD